MDPWNSLQIPWGGKKKKPLLTTHFIFLSGNKVSWKTYWKSLKSQCWNIKQISLRKYTKLWFIRGKKKKNNICLDMIYWKGERIIRGKLNLLLFLSWFRSLVILQSTLAKHVEMFHVSLWFLTSSFWIFLFDVILRFFGLLSLFQI